MRAVTPRGLSWGRRKHRGLRRTFILCSLCLLSAALHSPARAEDVTLRKELPTACLAWTAAAGCPTAPEMEATVEGVLGRTVFVKGSCDLEVSAAVQPLARGWQADLSLGNRGGSTLGTRKLTSQERDCAALVGPVALVIALMVETPEAQATLQVPAPPAPARIPSLDGVGFVTMEASSGLLPNAGFGATFGLGADPWQLVPFRVHATIWLPRSSERAGRGGEFWAWHAGLSLCPEVVAARTLTGALCAGVQAGAIAGEGSGLSWGHPITRPYGQGEVRAMASAPLSDLFAVTAHLGVAAPWLRPRFVYLDADGAAVEVYRPSALVFFGGLGVELRTSSGTKAGSP